ncbi:MAG: AmmeMemoRadiSam system protein A [Nitrospira sp.]|nr:AmmeMemoRadiSam system protein A [Nitrospira sp.]
MHPFVELAKNAIEHYVRSSEIISPPDNLSPEMSEKAGVFVSLKINGELRGCIGTFQPTTDSIAAEIIQNALSAAMQDPRFSPVSSDELSEITYSVDVLTAPEQISSESELDPKKYGVIVKAGERRGLLLPDLEGVDTVDEQLRIATMKANISNNEQIDLYRFEVKRYK